MRYGARVISPRLASTFSIVARDAETAELGVAVQSRRFNCGATVPWAAAGAGAIATQAFGEPGYGPRALALLREGRGAAEALDALLALDPGRTLRQVAIVDDRGGVAAHTGALCIPHACHRTGAGYSVQGNLLAGAGVCDAMAAAFERAPGSLARRMLAALTAAERAGGDARGREAAALLVERPVSRDEPWRNRVVDLRVEQHRKPIHELGRLLRLHEAFALLADAMRSLGEGRPDDARRLADEAVRRGQRHDEIGFWAGALHARMGDVERAVATLRIAIRRNPRWRSVLVRLPPQLAIPEAVLARALKRFDPRPRADRAPRRTTREPVS